MNKGIIMEIKKSYAITLSDEGVMDKIKFKENMKVGQKIFYFEDDIIKNSTSNVYYYNNFMKAFGSIAALFLIVFMSFNMIKPQEAYAVVSLDINPSIQIEADSKLNIIKVEGVNNDGKNIDFSDIKNIPLESGIQKIKDKLIEKNYLETNKEVLVGYAFIQSGDNSNYEKDLVGAINSTFNTETVTFVKADKEVVDEAKKKSISIGRYEAALEVKNQDIKNNIGTAPVKEITAIIKDNKDKQLNVQDEKNVTSSDASSKPETGNERTTVERPIINSSADNTQASTDSEKDKHDADKSGKGNGVLEVQPDVPAQSNPDTSSNTTNNSNTINNGNTNTNTNTNSTVVTPPKDNTINITPNNGTIENNTTSTKIKEESSNTITPEISKSTDNSGDKSTKTN